MLILSYNFKDNININLMPYAHFAFFNTPKFWFNSKGYFIEPTIVETVDPEDRIMVEEIFGPVLSVYVYREKDLDSTLRLVGESTPYALTGAVFGTDQ
jgi:acyl-CoA reductase-like NAD-dependent aldehyde dehydrogenase